MFGLFRKSPKHQDVALALYSAAVKQARVVDFYERHGVADTPDGRFDMIMLHVYVILRRLKDEGGEAKDLAQTLFDLMFADMDQNLREMGAGDIGVAHRIKDMAKAFYGRIAAYDEGLADLSGDSLQEALRRNLYRKTEPDAAHLQIMAGYLRRQAAAMARQEIADFLRGEVDFGGTARIEGEGDG